MRIKRTEIGCLVAWIFLLLPIQGHAGWETGAKGGFNSNVDRAVDGGKSDTFLNGYLSWWKGASGESRVDWSMSAVLEGTAYASVTGLDNAAITVSPGLALFPYLGWAINLSPFLQGKAVSDEDQSALTFGGKVSLSQPLSKHLYSGQYYVYRDSRAKEDIYSYTENVLGIFLGVNWTKTFFSEIGYEYSHGDSFRSISSSGSGPNGGGGQGPGNGKGRQGRYSSTFGANVVKEKVDRHSFGVSAGMDLTKSIFTQISYAYTIVKGDLGNSTDQQGFIGLGYRF
jgi:hypothetical protein